MKHIENMTVNFPKVFSKDVSVALSKSLSKEMHHKVSSKAINHKNFTKEMYHKNHTKEMDHMMFSNRETFLNSSGETTERPLLVLPSARWPGEGGKTRL